MSRAIAELMLDGVLSPQALARDDPRAISRVIESIGLESASEIVALLGPPQLLAALDDDAWRLDPTAGDDGFDAGRFATWLEVLALAGEPVVVSRLNTLDEDFLLMGLGSLFTVLTEDQWRHIVASADRADACEKALNRDLLAELGAYCILGRRREADRALEALNALYAGDGLYCDYLLERCSELSFERFMLGLEAEDRRTREDALVADVAAEREARRAQRGFIASADARAWLRGLLDRPPQALGVFAERSVRARQPAAIVGHESLCLNAIRLLDAEGRMARGSFVDELARLANILAAGIWSEAAPLSPADAAAATLATVDLALDAATLGGVEYARNSHAAAILQSQGLERTFSEGWRLLQTFAAETLISAPERDLAEALRGELPTDPRHAATSRDRFIRSVRQGCEIQARLAAGDTVLATNLESEALK